MVGVEDEVGNNQNGANMGYNNVIVLPRIAGTANFHANNTMLHML